MALKECVMNEEFMNPSDDTEETETSGSGYEQQNNTAPASEGVNTQQTGKTPSHVPYSRFKDVLDELNTLKGSGNADKPSSASQGVPEDKLWKATVEAKLSVPEHLKDKAEEIASYKAKYEIPMEDAIAIFDSKGKVSQADVEAAKAAQDEAAQSRTGGTANPAARSDAPDIKQMSDDELKAQLNQAIASGERL
jgi:hypothetical protein